MEELQRKSVAQKLRSEYRMKSRYLVELKEEVCIINMEMYRSKEHERLTDCGIRHPSLGEAVGWRKKLHQVTTRLQNVHLDDSPEHSYLKQLQRHVQVSLITASSQDTDVYDLVTFVADLNLLHGHLCGVKEEIENEINTALRALAKAHMHVTAQCDLSADGDSTDYMTHFVRQHVSLRRRKLPLQDRTNLDSSTNPHHSAVNAEPSTRSIVACDGGSPGFSTYPWLSQTDAVTSGSNIHIKHIHDNATRDVIHKKNVILGRHAMYKENVLLSDARCVQGSPNHRCGQCHHSIDYTASVRRSHKQDGSPIFSACTTVANSTEFSTGAKVDPGFNTGATNSQGFRPEFSTGAKDSPEFSTAAKVRPGFSTGTKVSPEFSIGVGCHHHGSSNGKIKLSHFSTPIKPVCNNMRRNPAPDSPHNHVCDSKKNPSCDSPEKPAYDNKKSQTCDSPEKPMADHVPDSHAMEPDNHAITTDNHAIEPDSHAMEPDNHAITTDNHAMEPDNHAMEPDSHAMEPENHAITTDNHAMEPDNHAMEPDSHAMEPDNHAMEPDNHAMEPDNHAMEPDSHAMEPDNHAMAPAAMISEVEPVMDIPYIDDEFL